MIDNLVFIKETNEAGYLKYVASEKFSQEGGSFQAEKKIIHVVGLIANWEELTTAYAMKSKKDLLSHLLVHQVSNLQALFSGSYAIVIEHIENDTWEIFSDRMGNTPLFFWKLENQLILTNSFQSLIQLLKKKNIKLEFSEEKAYQLLTFGYMLEGQTPFKNIFRLLTDEKIICKEGELKIIPLKRKATQDRSSPSLVLKDLCFELNTIFEKIISRNFELDLKYDYHHLVNLSAGLDSRTVTYVANKLGYGDRITNLTFSQSQFYDEFIPYKIIKDLNHKWIYNPLNTGRFLKNLDQVLNINGGLSIYYGMSHSWDTIQLASEQNFGLVHSGQLGDALLGGTYVEEPFNPSSHILLGAYSNRLKHKIHAGLLNNSYATTKEYLLKNRGINFINYGTQPYQVNHYSLSPFLDNELIDFVNEVPAHLLRNYYLYDRWILTHHPEIAKYKHNGNRQIGKAKSQTFRIFNRDIDLNLFHKKLVEKVLYNQRYSLFEMNPIAAWIDQNENLNSFFQTSFEQNLALLDAYPELKKDVEILFIRGVGKEKLLAITFLAALKKWFE
jgi:asparagine synthase (glutamine-hydrolysing)